MNVKIVYSKSYRETYWVDVVIGRTASTAHDVEDMLNENSGEMCPMQNVGKLTP